MLSGWKGRYRDLLAKKYFLCPSHPTDSSVSLRLELRTPQNRSNSLWVHHCAFKNSYLAASGEMQDQSRAPALTGHSQHVLFYWSRIIDLRSISQGPFPWLLTEFTCAVAFPLNSSGQAKGSNSRNNSRLNTTMKLEIISPVHRASQIASWVLRCPSAHHTLPNVKSKTHTWEHTEP